MEDKNKTTISIMASGRCDSGTERTQRSLLTTRPRNPLQPGRKNFFLADNLGRRSSGLFDVLLEEKWEKVESCRYHTAADECRSPTLVTSFGTSGVPGSSFSP